jgi:hypothetical protein
MGNPALRLPAEAALVLPRKYGYRVIGETKKSEWVKLYGLDHLHELSKHAKNFIVVSDVGEIVDYERDFPGSIKNIIVLCDGGRKLSDDTTHRFRDFLEDRLSNKNAPHIIMPLIMANTSGLLPATMKHDVEVYEDLPENLTPEFWTKHLADHLTFRGNHNLYVTALSDLKLVYNLTTQEQVLASPVELGRWFIKMELTGILQDKVEIVNGNRKMNLHFDHHTAGLIMNLETTDINPSVPAM